MTAVSFDPFSPEFEADRYAVFARIREHDPVHQSELGFWMVTRYADVDAFLRHPGVATIWGALEREGIDSGPLFETKNRWLFHIDPPQHTRIRKLVSRAFTPRVVRAMRPTTEAAVAAMMEPLAERDEIDVIADLAFPLPVRVICDLLGVPLDEQANIGRWADEVRAAMDPVPAPDAMVKAEAAVREFTAYGEELVEQRRAAPGDDLLSELIRVEEEGDRLTTEELIANVALLVGAGFETTMSLIGTLTYLLLTHPDQHEAVRSDPDLWPAAVEEALRFEPPSQFTERVTTADVEVGGSVIPKGENVVAVLASANRDPERFDDPDRFDVRRPDNQPLAFGSGIHFCVGAHLARMEGEVATRAVLDWAGDADLVDDAPAWKQGFVFRGLERLPLRRG